MNTITVTAYGTSGSFARFIQHRPAWAVMLFNLLDKMAKDLEADQDVVAERLLQSAKIAVETIKIPADKAFREWGDGQ
jgi:hypothetical protein